jgi:hypothetical protein
MSLVNIGTVLAHALRLLDKTGPPGGIELLSYKRNRTVTILHNGHSGMYYFRERGYEEQDLTVTARELPRLLKSAIRREFPRSRKVRIFKITDPDQLDRDRQKI